MDTGLMIRWGPVQAGREDQALALFNDTVNYFASLMESGKISGFEPYMFTVTDFEEEAGFFIVKGSFADIFALMDSDEYKSMVTKANLLLHHVKISMVNFGDGVAAQLDQFNKARAELHI